MGPCDAIDGAFLYSGQASGNSIPGVTLALAGELGAISLVPSPYEPKSKAGRNRDFTCSPDVGVLFQGDAGASSGSGALPELGPGLALNEILRELSRPYLEQGSSADRRQQPKGPSCSAWAARRRWANARRSWASRH